MTYSQLVTNGQSKMNKREMMKGSHSQSSSNGRVSNLQMSFSLNYSHSSVPLEYCVLNHGICQSGWQIVLDIEMLFCHFPSAVILNVLFEHMQCSVPGCWWTLTLFPSHCYRIQNREDLQKSLTLSCKHFRPRQRFAIRNLSQNQGAVWFSGLGVKLISERWLAKFTALAPCSCPF